MGCLRGVHQLRCAGEAMWGLVGVRAPVTSSPGFVLAMAGC